MSHDRKLNHSFVSFFLFLFRFVLSFSPVGSIYRMPQNQGELVVAFRPKYERVRGGGGGEGGGGGKGKELGKTMGPDEQRIKIRMALRALDERDLEANIVTWLKHAAIQGSEDTPRVLLSELFHGLDASNVNGRKQRYG